MLIILALNTWVNISWRNIHKEGSSSVRCSCCHNWFKIRKWGKFFYRTCCACFDPIFESPYKRNSSHFPNKRVWGATGNDTLSRMLNMINAPKLPIWLMDSTWLASPTSYQPRLRYLTPTITYASLSDRVPILWFLYWPLIYFLFLLSGRKFLVIVNIYKPECTKKSWDHSRLWAYFDGFVQES